MASRISFSVYAGAGAEAAVREREEAEAPAVAAPGLAPPSGVADDDDHEAEFDREAEVKDAEREKRIKIAEADATAIEGENLSEAKVAKSKAELAVKRAEARLDHAQEVLPVLLYNTAFRANRLGEAATIGILLLGIVLAFSILYIRAMRLDRDGGRG